MKKYIILLFFPLFFSITFSQTYTPRQDYQWYTSISTTDNKGSAYTLTPYMWIPPGCQKVNAVFVASTAVLEQLLVESPEIRAVFSRRGVAILWSSDNFYHDDVTATGQIQTMLNVFSSLTGYTELKTVPWIVTGHSGTNPMPRYIVKTTPEKVALAIINKATAQCGSITSVPILSTNGEFMEWDSYSKDLKANISSESSYADVRNNRTIYNQPLSYFFDPNTGHFDCSRPLLKNIAMWLDDIWDLRFDSNGNMITLDQTKGWIVGLPCAGYTTDKFMPITYTNQATGSLTLAQVKAAAWFPSQRTAQAAYDMANVSMTRTTQVTGFVNPADGTYDAQSYWWRAIMLKIPFTLGSDGHSVTLSTAAYTRMPNRTDYFDNAFNPTQSFYNKADNSFTNSGNPNQIEVCSGNWKQTGTNTFEYIPRFKSTNYFIVRQQGDATYRTSVQAGNVNLTSVTGGTTNTITLNAIANQNYSSLNPVTLAATSTAGVTVRYFVNSGPAHVSGNQLIFDKDSIPPKAHFPIPVTVTAYHLGTASPVVNTATSVSRTFYIMNGALTPLSWFVAPTALGTGDGTSWANACSIQTAVSYATYGDNIFMKAGDYNLSASLSVDSKVLNIYGGFAGTESQISDRQLSDLDNNGIVEPWEFTNKTRLVGGRYKATPVSFTVFKITGGTASNVRIDGISVEEGLYLGGGNPAGVNLAGSCTFANSVVRNCRVFNSLGDVNSQGAGGIVSSVSDAIIDGCLIENCESQASQVNSTRGGQCKGGGAYLYGTIQNSVVRNNRNIYDMIRPAGNTYTIYYNPYLYGTGIYLMYKSAKAINCLVYNNETRILNWDAVNYTTAQLNSIVVRGVGISAENGGSVLNCTVVNNKACVKDLNGNSLSPGSGGQGVGIYLKSNNSATNNNEAYLINNVAWGNVALGTSASDQHIRLDISTSAGTATPIYTFYNNVTPAVATNASTATSAYFLNNGANLINLSVSNTTVSTGPLFLYPTSFAGAIWGTVAQASADSLKSISKANWTIQSGSYLIGKGTISYTAAGSTTLNTPTLDLIGTTRSVNLPAVGAYETQYWTSPTGFAGLFDFNSKVYRSGNEIFNLTAGDKVTVYDACGRKLQVLRALTNQLQLSSNGFVIVSVQHPSGETETVK